MLDTIIIGGTLTEEGLRLMLDATVGANDLVQPIVEVQVALLIIEIAKRVEDNPQWFPSGKWATVQALQNRCEAELYKVGRFKL